MNSVTICASVSFYRKALVIRDELASHGIPVLLPASALLMEARNDFEPSHYQTWFKNEADYAKKADLMRTHFMKVVEGDICLVVNETKHGQTNYIGSNVLIEMPLAFYLNKPIYILNDFPTESSFLEEIKGMLPTALHGDLGSLIRAST